MRGRVSTQEELWRARRRSGQQGFTIRFAFENGQAIQVGSNATRKHIIPIFQEMVSGDGRSQPIGSGGNEFSRHRCCDVLQHDPQTGVPLKDAGQRLLDERLFPIENIDSVTRHFTVKEQRHFLIGHGIENMPHGLNVGHP